MATRAWRYRCKTIVAIDTPIADETNWATTIDSESFIVGQPLVSRLQDPSGRLPEHIPLATEVVRFRMNRKKSNVFDIIGVRVELICVLDNQEIHSIGTGTLKNFVALAHLVSPLTRYKHD